MTTSPDNDFQYRLTESLLSQTCNSTLSLLPHQTAPRIIAHSPSYTTVLHNKESDASFNGYPGSQAKEPSNYLRPPGYTKQDKVSTPWGYLTKDLESTSSIKLEPSHEYESIISEKTSLITTTFEFFSPGAYLFLFGFIFPPCWWVGSFYPTRAKKEVMYSMDENVKMAIRWRLLNRFFSLGFSTLLITAIIVLAIIYSKT
ncbi:uncharacterized protein EV154DRAFT_523181 [Mucor mucedo]|uniref:uncharacterized protein n=1 Tax=Mucor mucedo TaxID=29922 RepID=UPI0022204BE5|nr:uncharacterized protein EV154DRAFT_523181 [Mucor mucedo]KAI7882134.1 hypothetical protein EV154DRAFT_523181 [Mucor mucedo]